MSNGIHKLLFLLVMVGLVGCQSTHVIKSSSESINQVKRYYDNLQHPLDFNRSMYVLEKVNNNENNNSISLHSVGAYLISNGYKVTRTGEPRFNSSSEKYSIYDVDIDVIYPKESKLKPMSTTEHVWINDENRMIYKIESEDVYISARADNYLFSGK